MRYPLPTVKLMTKRGIDPLFAVMIRVALEDYSHKPDFCMEKINLILGGYGVEYIAAGKMQKSPAITYVNMGNTYSTTVLFINGRFSIGSWGSIVERGNYA